LVSDCEGLICLFQGSSLVILPGYGSRRIFCIIVWRGALDKIDVLTMTLSNVGFRRISGALPLSSKYFSIVFRSFVLIGEVASLNRNS
jgi:hypothetical protein